MKMETAKEIYDAMLALRRTRWAKGDSIGWKELVITGLKQARCKGADDMQEMCAKWMEENVWNGKDAAKQLRALSLPGENDNG